jgi:hypothetical protein
MLNGLVTKSSAPIRKPRTLEVSSPAALRIMTGTSSPRSRSVRSTRKPSGSGIPRSSRIRSGLNSLAWARAAVPSAATETSYPSISRLLRRPKASSGLSSTTRIRRIPFFH